MNPRLLLFLTTGLLTCAAVSTSWACSISTRSGIFWPHNGAENVPTSTRIFVGSEPDPVELVTAEGSVIPIRFEPLTSEPTSPYDEVRYIGTPQQSLQPNTTYTIQIADQTTLQSFTTGDGSSAQPPEELELVRYEFAQHSVKSWNTLPTCADISQYNTKRTVTIRQPSGPNPIVYTINGKIPHATTNDANTSTFIVYELRDDTTDTNPDSICLTITATFPSGQTASLGPSCEPDTVSIEDPNTDGSSGCSTLSAPHNPNQLPLLLVLSILSLALPHLRSTTKEHTR